jgi:alpha-tubulin suppressor-like RCC1 family protein
MTKLSLSAVLLCATVAPALTACGLLPPDGLSKTSKLKAAKAKQVIAGRLHSCALTTEGAVRCWGYREHGALGIGPALPDGDPQSNHERFLASQVVGLESGVVQIATAAYADFTCALLEAGTVKCWGNDDYGNLGDGKTNLATTPVDVVGVASATAISVGSASACALLADRHVRCWGAGQSGQLGNNARSDSKTAVEVSGLSGVASLASGGDQSCATTVGGAVSCALTAAGRVKCWGNNKDGQLGANLDVQSSIAPVDVVGLDAGVTDVAVGDAEGAAVVDGKIRRWGTQPIPSKSTLRPTPEEGPALPAPAAQLAVGQAHMCALSTTGAVYCWGNNEGGQVGFYDNLLGEHYEEAPLPVSSLR